MKKCRMNDCVNDVEREGHLVCRPCVRRIVALRDGTPMPSVEDVTALFDVLNKPVFQ